MSKRLPVLITFVLSLTVAPTGFSQCKNRTVMLPLLPMKAAAKSRNFIRYKYSLSPSDTLLVQSHEDTDTTIGPYDLGLLIAQHGKTIQSMTLRELPEFRREDSFFSESFSTVAVTRACPAVASIYFVTMKYIGDEISPALIFVVIPSGEGYKISRLPFISGGTVDVSTANPLHLRVWDNLHEGMCNACDTPYKVTEYEIRDGKPVQTRQYRTKHLYNSGQFPDSRIRFIP